MYRERLKWMEDPWYLASCLKKKKIESILKGFRGWFGDDDIHIVGENRYQNFIDTPTVWTSRKT